MLLLIPVDKKDYKKANIARISIKMDNGYIEKYSFFDKRDDIEEFLDDGATVLIAPL